MMAEAAAAGRATVTVTPDELADLYSTLAMRLRQIVGGKTQAPDPLVEDACQFAWGSLVHHRTAVRRETALGWLITTAVREAIRLMGCQRRELSLEELSGGGPTRRFATPTDELVEQKMKLASITRLPERQQRLVWLQGLGFSYGEMADHEGATPRTVERQLLRAKRRLREAA